MGNAVNITNVTADYTNLWNDIKTQAWGTFITDAMAMVSDVASLVGNDSNWAAVIGGSAGYQSAQAAWNSVLEEYNSGGAGNVKISDLLSAINGYSTTLAAGALAVSAATGNPVPLAFTAVVGTVGALSGGIGGALTAAGSQNTTIGQIGGILTSSIDSYGDTIFNVKNGGSSVVSTNGLESGYQSIVQTYSGQSGTGTLLSTTITSNGLDIQAGQVGS